MSSLPQVHPSLPPFRLVVGTRNVTNKYCRPNEGCRWHHLECGHEIVRKQSYGFHARMRCPECWQDILRDRRLLSEQMDALRKELAVFKARMNRVAEKNGDEFKVTMTFEADFYRIEVTETADNHVLLAVTAPANAVIEAALKSLPDALASWGYTNAD